MRSEPPEPLWRIVGAPVGVLLLLAGLALAPRWRTEPTTKGDPPAVATILPGTEPEAEPEPASIASPEPTPTPPPPAPALDREAVGRAEAALSATRRARSEAEGRVVANEAALAAARRKVEEAERSARSRVGSLEATVARARQVVDRVEILDAERRKIGVELAALAKAPKPGRKPLLDRTPVARPAEGSEFHFEIRRDRVAFIDLDRLLDKVKTDARLRLRVNDSGGPIASTVGPVGAFSLAYELGRSLPEAIEDLLGSRASNSYSLRGWEVVPEFEGRGESFDVALRAASEFGRTIHRLHPERDTITLWIYPDGFPLYRKLRDLLHERGFTVAARPLPEGIPIRGSPGGSLSAGQ